VHSPAQRSLAPSVRTNPGHPAVLELHPCSYPKGFPQVVENYTDVTLVLPGQAMVRTDYPRRPNARIETTQAEEPAAITEGARRRGEGERPQPHLVCGR